MEKEEKYCGGCAFLISEDAYGHGSCPYDFGRFKHCEDKSCKNHISKKKVRHSAAILAQYRRFQRALTLDRGNSIPGVLVPFDGDKISDAIEIITRYVNVITKKV